MAEVIIFGQHALTEEEFLPIFEEWYEIKKIDFKKALGEIVQTINKMTKEVSKIHSSSKKEYKARIGIKGKFDAKKIYDKWEEINRDYFGNGTVTLIAAVKFHSDSYHFTNNIEEKQFINERGINIRNKGLNELQKQMEDIGGIFAAAEIQNLLNEHYNSLLVTLGSYTLNTSEALAMHQLLETRKSSLNRHDFHFTGSTYSRIIFGGQSNATGKQLDAFMNHMGNYHNEIFSLMAGGNVSAAQLQEASPFEIDNDFPNIFASPGTVQPWLLDSLNTASWLTGGDIIVVGSRGEVIYNIQLKSTGRGKTFDLGTAALLNFSERMLRLMDDSSMSPKELAKVMFNQLKTSVANEMPAAEDFYSKKIDDEVRKNLGISTSGSKTLPIKIPFS